MSAIFLSHASADGEASARLKAWLERRGHRSLFLDFDPQRGIPAGRDWERELYLQLKSCRALIILCSPASMASKWCFAELAISRSLGKPIFPLLVEPCELPSQLTEMQVLDLEALGFEPAMERLARGLAEAGVETAAEFDWDAGRSPYPGLLAFQEADAAIFFGREREVGEASEILNRSRRYGQPGLVLVLGASGSGKSSLVRAGLLPRLRLAPESWLVVDPFRPRDDPLREASGALAATGGRLGLESGWRELHDRLAAGLAADPGSPAALDAILDELRLASPGREATPLLVIDQFEELLGQGPDHPARAFAALLRAAVERSGPAGGAAGPGVVALGTMRSDFLGAFQTDAELGGLEFGGLPLGPPTPESLVRIIEGPAELAALDLEPGLAPALLEEMDTPDALPLLAFTLSELYKRRDGGGLTVRAFREELGGLKGSVARAAEGVLAERRWDERDRDDLRAAFLSLARLDDEGRYSRRSLGWDELGQRVGGVERARELLEPFLAARLLVTRGEGDADSVEVAHEALFRSWRTLAGWLDDNRDDLRLAADLARAATEWRDGGRGEEFHWRGGRLERAVELSGKSVPALGEAELEFVEASAAAERRHRRRRRRMVQAVVAASLAVAAVMWLQYGKEKRARDLADSQVSRYLARQAGERRAGELDLALLLGVKAYRTSPTFEAASELLSGLGSTPRLRSFLPGAESTVRAVAWDPAGRLVAFGGNDARLHLWDVEAGRRRCEAPLEGDKNWLRALAFAPAGGRLVSGSDDGVLRLWDAESCEPLGELGRHEGAVAGLAFAAGERLVSAGSDDRRVKLWDLGGGGVELGELPDTALSLAASADGAVAAAGTLNGVIRLWDLETGAALDDAERRLAGAVSSLALSPDGRLLASGGGEDEGVRLWRLSGRRAGKPLAAASAAAGAGGGRAADPSREALAPPGAPSHRAAVSSLAFSRDGRVLASGSLDGTIRVWDAADPGRLLRLAGGGEIYRLALDPASPRRLVAARGGAGSVELWDVALPGDEALRGLTDPVALAYGASGLRLAVVDDGTVRFLDPGTGRPQGQPFPSSAAGERVGDIAFSRNGRYLATGGDDGTVRLWDPVTRQQWELPEGHEYAVRALAFSADGELIAAGSEDTTVRVWSVTERRLLHVLPHDDWVNAVAFGDGDELATAGDDGLLRLWGARAGGPLAEPLAADPDSPFPNGIAGLAYEPGGGRLAAAYGDGTVVLWGRRGERLTAEPLGVDGPAAAVAFSADGGLLAGGAASGTLHLWQVGGGQSGLRLTPLATVGSAEGLTALEFDPTRRVLAVVRAGAAELVDLTGIDAWAEAACGRANRNLSREEWDELIGANVPYRPVCPER